MSPRYLMAMAAGGLLIAAVPLSPIHAQAKPTPAAIDSVKSDAKFIREATADNLMEVRLGEMAGRRSTTTDVKNYGQRMVTDHQKLADQWTGLATKYGVELKPGLGPGRESKVDKLQRADQKAFDREYMTTMIVAHEIDVDSLQKGGTSAHSEPVRKLAAYELPIVREHLLDARKIGKLVGVDSATVERSRSVAERK
jgi:putative membrane protein